MPTTSPPYVDESSVQPSSFELLGQVKTLEQENRELRQTRDELSGQLHDVQQSNVHYHHNRLAALNLLEDAVEARHRMQVESEERRRVEETLRQEDRRKNEFLATLAHELRNPLAPIRNSLQILRLSENDRCPIQVIGMLERQLNHLVHLVDDLLEVSRITRGMIQLRKEPVDLVTLIQEVYQLSKPLSEVEAQDFTLILPDHPVILDADPVRLTQIISNLVNNAIKYTPHGGQIQLILSEEETSIIISVRDNGLGIPQEMLSKVFEIFTQVDRTLDRAQGGLGIGLALVRRLVELHGGSVEGRSEGHHQGSEFIVRLPKTGDVGPLRPAKSIPTHATAIQHTILIVDDNQDAAQSLASLLTFLGAQVTVAFNGKDAVQLFKESHPQVVLLDIGMPGMNGHEVARQIRELDQQVLLIALTGWGQEDDRQKTKDAGFNHHLLKPVELSMLQSLIHTLDAESHQD